MPLLVSILQVSADVGATLLSQCSSCARRLVLSAELSFLFLISSYSSPYCLCGFAQKTFWIETRKALRLSQILDALLHWDARKSAAVAFGDEGLQLWQRRLKE
jgi:hypothetical protein